MIVFTQNEGYVLQVNKNTETAPWTRLQRQLIAGKESLEIMRTKIR
jgi:hypothetical protein